MRLITYRTTQTLAVLIGFLAARAEAQSILFDFENAPIHSPLPISLTVGGVTARFSATGQGFSIQPANTMGFTPAGFSGLCIYPSSVYAADLLVGFSRPLTNFSILYAPQELGCDSSATMRLTAYLDNTLVGTSTTNASIPGTWPSETLAFGSGQAFNRVVIHYDARPACQDWGPIFMADNMIVTPGPPPIVLAAPVKLPEGGIQFAFTNTPGATFTMLATTNPALPLANWSVLGSVPEIAAGQFQFTDLQATNSPRRFYRIRSP